MTLDLYGHLYPGDLDRVADALNNRRRIRWDWLRTDGGPNGPPDSDSSAVIAPLPVLSHELVSPGLNLRRRKPTDFTVHFRGLRPISANRRWRW